MHPRSVVTFLTVTLLGFLSVMLHSSSLAGDAVPSMGPTSDAKSSAWTPDEVQQCLLHSRRSRSAGAAPLHLVSFGDSHARDMVGSVFDRLDTNTTTGLTEHGALSELLFRERLSQGDWDRNVTLGAEAPTQRPVNVTMGSRFRRFFGAEIVNDTDETICDYDVMDALVTRGAWDIMFTATSLRRYHAELLAGLGTLTNLSCVRTVTFKLTHDFRTSLVTPWLSCGSPVNTEAYRRVAACAVATHNTKFPMRPPVMLADATEAIRTFQRSDFLDDGHHLQPSDALDAVTDVWLRSTICPSYVPSRDAARKTHDLWWSSNSTVIFDRYGCEALYAVPTDDVDGNCHATDTQPPRPDTWERFLGIGDARFECRCANVSTTYTDACSYVRVDSRQPSKRVFVRAFDYVCYVSDLTPDTRWWRTTLRSTLWGPHASRALTEYLLETCSDPSLALSGLAHYRASIPDTVLVNRSNKTHWCYDASRYDEEAKACADAKWRAHLSSFAPHLLSLLSYTLQLHATPTSTAKHNITNSSSFGFPKDPPVLSVASPPPMTLEAAAALVSCGGLTKDVLRVLMLMLCEPAWIESSDNAFRATFARKAIRRRRLYRHPFRRALVYAIKHLYAQQSRGLWRAELAPPPPTHNSSETTS